MISDKVKELGWKRVGTWANRDVYSLSEKSKFSIFEHNGDWGLQDPYRKDFSLIYCNMSNDDICKFTGIVKLFDDMFDNPKAYTLYQYIETEILMQDFIKEMKEKE